MRVIELLLLIITISAVTGAFSFLRDRRKASLILTAAALILLIFHFIFNGPRWQMTFVYISLAALTAALFFPKKEGSKQKTAGRWISLILKTVCILFFVTTVVLLSLFPLHKMPVPDGPFKVGTISYEINDSLRMEVYGPEPGSPRRIKFQLWYPADSTAGGKRTKWMSDGSEVTTGIPKVFGVPDFILAHTALIDSNSYEGIEVSSSEAAFPLVIISHGWTGFMNLHSDLGEMLASHGYIAVSINHTYGALVSVFDNGDVIYADPDALPERKAVDNFDLYSRMLVNTYALDTALVLDYLTELSGRPGLLGNRIDLEKTGVLGHSTGGGGGVQLAIADSRIKSVFGMDAWVEPIEQEILTDGLSVPACLLRSEQWATGPNNDFLGQLINASKTVPDIYQINGCNHLDFSMLYMYDPMTALTGSQGRLDSRENAAIQQDWVLTFFNNTLKGLNTDLSRLEEKYDAVMRVRDFD